LYYSFYFILFVLIHLKLVLLGAICSGFVLGGMMNAVVGDTVGDPFKDTSGPAINIQIKHMSYISVVLVPVFKEQKDCRSE
jgi:hypothetical protein